MCRNTKWRGWRYGYQAIKILNLLHVIIFKAGNRSYLLYNEMWSPQVSRAFESIMKRSPFNVGYGDHLYLIFAEIYGLSIPH